MRLHRRTSILLAASLTACHAATPAFTDAFHELMMPAVPLLGARS
ncbi:MAG TPA: hypothetical protein VNM36_06940 [Gemmatimonadaceae bacterium]|nr:hypothetical protein [Gemmatimonadaceae bacterium]